MATDLRFTAAGRAAIADGAHRGLNKLTFTKISIGSGYGPGGSADDGRVALRNERHSAALEGSTAVAGEVALCAEIRTNAAYDVREIGLWGKKGDAGTETLYAYWTDPDAANKFASAVVDGTILVAGALRVNPEGAELNVTVTARVTLESQGLQPLWLLPMPHVETATHQLAVAAAAATAGGTVTVAAAQKLSLGKASANGSSAFSKGVTTTAWSSADLDINATYYLRAQLTAAGALTLYVQKGADDDDAPASLRGTPGAAQGGGFASTVLDARLAKIVTGAAGTAPAGTRYALEATPRPGISAWAGAEDYPHPSAAWGSDANLYATKQSSGPSHGGPVDPATDADRSHWYPALKLSGRPDGVPAGTDKVGFADLSTPGKEDRLVEIRKLPGALAAGALATNKKYALKYLASGAFELALVGGASMFMAINVGIGGDYKPLGTALSLPAGVYDLRAAAAVIKGQGAGARNPFDLGFQARSTGSSIWSTVASADPVDGNFDRAAWEFRGLSGWNFAGGDIRVVGRLTGAPGGGNIDAFVRGVMLAAFESG